MQNELESVPNYQVPALDKGLDILECLANSGSALTQAQIARELGRNPSEIFRILTTLERRGYLRRSVSSGAYELTLRLFELGHTYSPFEHLLRAANQPMRDLSDQTGQMCYLSVLQHNLLVVLDRVESLARVRVSVETGSTHALLRSASGRLLLAALTDPERVAVEKSHLEFQALTQEERDYLNRRLARIQTRGYEESYSESIQGVTDIAVLVGNPDGKVKAALAVAAMPRERAAFIRQMVNPMQLCAFEIGKAAGLLTR